MREKSDKLQIALISVHGLIRSQNLELGRDADTGGQTLYVLELAQALSDLDEVESVQLYTRRIVDEGIDEIYSQPIEQVNEKLSIIRIDAGPEAYIYKEHLWDYLDNFADNLVQYLHETNKLPDVIHSHYADAGMVGAHVANLLGIPLIHTGHSLGRVKRRRLLASGLSQQEIETLYNISRRIEAEELTLATAERVITSTNQEIEEQYEIYDYYQPEQMRVLPPGTNIKQFKPPEGGELHSSVYLSLTQHLKEPNKPIILALSRPDKRKNIAVLVEAYGQSIELQKSANLVIVAGNRDDIDDLEQGAQDVFHEVLVTIDRYDLYGKVALPKHHQRDQVPLIYRIAAASGGVFVNPALTEPFGLTLIEAAASGLPIVATEDGGPRDIIGNCHNGLLIDPLESTSITDALLTLFLDPQRWKRYSEEGLKGVSTHYSWQAHAKRYLDLIRPIVNRAEVLHRYPIERTSQIYAESAIVTDLDLNLIGNETALRELLQLLRQNRKRTKFVIASGRRLDSALRLMKKHGIPEPDILITSSGTEICYAPKLTQDNAWRNHIDYQWMPQKIRLLLKDIPGLELQPKAEQSEFKISYYYDPQQTELEEIQRLLHQHEQSAHIQVAFGQYLDILPIRASKGMALRYVADRWQIPLDQILVAGGSGADEEMMRGNTLGVVVANRHHEELSQLVDTDRIYFAKSAYAAGILEALEYYQFFNETQRIKENYA